MTTEIQTNTKDATVLVVDDEPFIRDLVGMMLEGLGCSVLLAGSGDEGVQLVEKHRDEIFLVLCDLSMPEMDGWQTISAIRLVAPELPVVLTSGYTVDEKTCRKYHDQPWAIMNKPYGFDNLENLLRQVRQRQEGVAPA